MTVTDVIFPVGGMADGEHFQQTSSFLSYTEEPYTVIGVRQIQMLTAKRDLGMQENKDIRAPALLLSLTWITELQRK